MVARLEQTPLYNEDYSGRESFVRLLVIADDKTAATPALFTVEYRATVDGEWLKPNGWTSGFLSGISAHFAWRVCPGGAYIQVTRWLEMELYINGELRPELQSILATMSEQDFVDSFEKCFVGPTGASFRRPYELWDLEARIEKKRLAV